MEPILERAREPFPVPVRTLDAVYLASILFLRQQGAKVRLASYDRRMLEATQAMGIPEAPDLA